jgi:hypothetical protein
MLRCLRLASGLRAAIVLVQAGYLQETCVLLRTLQEFVHDLDLVIGGFIDENVRPTLEKRVTEYFSHDMRTPADMMADTSKTASMPRKNVYAAVGRSLSPNNPYHLRQLTKAIEEAYSGYVHGAYQHTMEMYDGGRMCFSTADVSHSLQVGLPAIAMVMQPALSGFADFARSLGLKAIAEELYDQRAAIEKSALYQS